MNPSNRYYQIVIGLPNAAPQIMLFPEGLVSPETLDSIENCVMGNCLPFRSHVEVCTNGLDGGRCHDMVECEFCGDIDATYYLDDKHPDVLHVGGSSWNTGRVPYPPNITIVKSFGFYVG